MAVSGGEGRPSNVEGTAAPDAPDVHASKAGLGAGPVRDVTRRVPVAGRRAFDVGAVIALAVTAYLARRGTLPTDGLWFDDSWVAAGAVHGRISALMTVGSGHPGFTGILMAVHRLGGGATRDLGVPSLVIGIVTPSLLYLALRRFGYERAVAALVSAPLAVSAIHVLYSGRVKGYTLDTLLVLGLAVALPVLARRRWSWPVAAAWAAGAVVVGTFSGYVLVASAVAGLILVLHPTSDRLVRVVGVGAQAAVQGGYFLVARSKTDLDGIEEVMELEYDGHISLTLHPVDLVREVLKHLRRLAEVYPAGPGDHPRVLAVLAVTSLAGLALAAVRGRRTTETLVGRFLLALVAVAFFGATVDRFPFGTSNVAPLSAGGRHTLWLVPALAFGLASLLHRLRGLVARRDVARFGFDAVAVAAAVLVAVVVYQPAQPAPFPGGASAARFVEEQRGPNGLVVVTNVATFSFAVNSSVPATLRPTPEHQVGFAPVYLDPMVRNVGGWSYGDHPEQSVAVWAKKVDRVLVIADGALGGSSLDAVGAILRRQGFTTVERRTFGWSAVAIWER